MIRQDDVHHRFQVAIEETHHLSRIEALRNRREAAHIRHQNGHRALFGGKVEAFGGIEELGHHLFRDVAAKGVADKLLRASSPSARVEFFFHVISVFGDHIQYHFQIVALLLEGVGEVIGVNLSLSPT